MEVEMHTALDPHIWIGQSPIHSYYTSPLHISHSVVCYFTPCFPTFPFFFLLLILFRGFSFQGMYRNSVIRNIISTWEDTMKYASLPSNYKQTLNEIVNQDAGLCHCPYLQCQDTLKQQNEALFTDSEGLYYITRKQQRNH